MNESELIECAKRKCRHKFKEKELVYVKPPIRTGPKTLPKWIGTCPKCGGKEFYDIPTNPPQIGIDV